MADMHGIGIPDSPSETLRNLTVGKAYIGWMQHAIALSVAHNWDTAPLP